MVDSMTAIVTRSSPEPDSWHPHGVPSLRGTERRSNPFFLSLVRWIASLRSEGRRGRSVFYPKNLPRFGWACDGAPDIARAGRDRLDQLPVRGHLGTVAKIKRVL